jgi:hypothetical protein
MRFLESALRRRVSRRINVVEPGPRAKFVVFFSAAIGSPSTAVSDYARTLDATARRAQPSGQDRGIDR